MNAGETPALRLSVLGIVVISLFAALFSRLWYLQVMDSKTFLAAAKQNQVQIVYEPAPRGRILDRNGAVLVDNRYRFVVSLPRQSVTQHPDVTTRVAALLNMSLDDVNKRVADPRYSQYKPVPIADDVTKDVAIQIKEQQDEFPGVEVTRVAERVYPNGALAAHVLGNVGQVTSDELKKLRKDGYREGDEIGRAGVERAYEKYLRGEPGVTKLAVDATGNVLPVALGPPKRPVPGRDVQLTIDAGVQRLAEDSLAQGLEAARNTTDRDSGKKFTAPAGAAVVLNPNDGSVLALASYPTYDPTVFVGGIKQAVFDEMSKKENHFPLNDRAIQGQYPPGSTFKLFTSLAALDKGIIDPRTTVDDQGKFTIKNCLGEQCVYRNAGGLKYGKVNLAGALTVSSDVFFYQLGATFWGQRAKAPDAMQEMARTFGLGSRTGIPLLGEQPGRVWTPADKKRAHEQRPKDFPFGNWQTGDNVNLAIGQGDLAITPLQLSSAYGAFATGGLFAQPRIAARVLDPQSRPVADLPMAPTRQITLPAGSDAVRQGLQLAISDSKGTGYPAFAGFPLASFPIAGKTGTAQVPPLQ
ncbi:MAG TPA: penicillin-binding protein 2, partial [Acidimicrobiales bacterium]|nr:penicillin-binding protein 2 [Acidimicrobiales bacterium]